MGSKSPARGKGKSLEQGPVLVTREAVRGASPTLRFNAAAAGLAVAVGINDDIAEAIVSAIDVLLAQGESPLEVRVRLNPDPARVGRREAPKDRSARIELAWAALLHEDDEDEEGAA
jgi:hypothetical protein